MERSEEDMSLKNPVTPPGIDPGTVRLVAQRLNHYATPGPHRQYVEIRKEDLSDGDYKLAFLLYQFLSFEMAIVKAVTEESTVWRIRML